VHGRSWLVERSVRSIPLTNETSTPQIVTLALPTRGSFYIAIVIEILFLLCVGDLGGAYVILLRGTARAQREEA